jgi:phosphocarrier protein
MAMETVAVTVTNPLGLHARAAARFVRLAGTFTSQVRVARGSRSVDGKSILGLLSLAAARGTTLDIRADGPDAVEAAAALRALIERGFDE